MNLVIVALAVCAALTLVRATNHDAIKFGDVIRAIEEKQVQLSKHEFFAMLGDETIPAKKRMSFAPYMTYFAMAFADILQNWIRIPNPQTEQEHRVNVFVSEDNFHYNFLLNDLDNVLGYTMDRYGSYSGVMRHIWGDDSRAVRRLMYTWTACVRRSNDPIISMTTFEAIEAGLKDIFEVAYTKVYLPDGGLKELQYFGKTHVELEVNHTITSWFRDGEHPFRPLADYELTEETRDIALEVVDEIFERFVMHYKNLCLLYNYAG